MDAYSSFNPGKLDRRVTLLFPVLTRGRAGGDVKTWVEFGSVWADWNPQTGREVQEAAQFVSLATGLMRIRHRLGLGADWRVQMGDTVFELTAPPTEVGRKVYLDLNLRAIAGDAPDALSVRFLHDYSPRLLHDGSFALLHTAA